MSSAAIAYRNMLRAANLVFKGDTRVLKAARLQIVGEFRRKTWLQSPEKEEAIAEAEKVTQFLRQNVVQGLRQSKTGAYKLNIHEDTERGDNDTIKLGNQNIKIDGKTCKDT